MIKFSFKTKVYYGNIRVFVGEPDRFLRRKFWPLDVESLAGCVGVCQTPAHYLFWLRRYPKDPESFSTFAHETYHLTTEILNFHNVGYDKDCDETRAILHGYLVETILRKLRNKKSKIK